MIYKNIKEAKFINRPNRFIANIEIDGRNEVCHVKNTGRCKELLIPGAKVFVEEADNCKRKTKYDLVSVYKGDMLVNIDSNAPNKVFYEWLSGFKERGDILLIKPEAQYKNSRFDFYIETAKSKGFVEVKGVTLEKDGVALFPDAPTERGVKHLNELIDAKQNGYMAWIVFIVQMQKVRYFMPNETMHKAFSDALKAAQSQKVNIIALDCGVTKDSIEIKNQVNIKL